MDSPAAPPKKWHTREDSGIELDENLDWWHDGERIEHPNIIEAFNRGVRVMPDGRYQLVFGNDWCFIKVAHCGFRVVTVDVVPDAGFSVRLSDRTAEPLDLRSLALDASGVLTAKVKQGVGTARFSREAQFQLAEHLERHDGQVVARVGDARWPTSLPSSVLE